MYQLIEQRPDLGGALKQRLEKTRIRPGRGDSSAAQVQIKPVHLPQLAIAHQLASERLNRGMLEHNSGNERVPHRAHRKIIATAATAQLQLSG